VGSAGLRGAMSLVTLDLLRDIRTPHCTSGVLTVGGSKLYAIERPWIPNPDGGRSGKRFESCVAAGTYKLIPHRSEKYVGSIWALINPTLDVYHQPGDVPPGRELQARVAILIHYSNYWWEVLGCIAPGKSRGKHQADWAVWRSREAMNDIKTVIGNKLDVTLTIRWAEGVKP
jgi:hypothetical protein